MPRHALSISGSPVHGLVERASQALDAGFDGLSLEPPLHAPQWEALRGALPREKVVRISAFLPYPRALRPGEPCPFLLGSAHPEDRREVLKQASETILCAEQHRIPVVTLPPFRLDGVSRERLDRPRRAQAAARPLDALRSVVARLAEAADRYAITLAVVPGGFADEAPGPAEALELLRELAGAPILIWPETARLAAARSSGLWDVDPAEALQGKLAGITLRDLTEDGEPTSLDVRAERAEAWRPLLSMSPVWLADPGPDVDSTPAGECAQLLRAAERGPEPGEKAGFKLF